MNILTLGEAKDLFKEVLETLWQARRQPILGSQLKAVMISRAGAQGKGFDEKALGFRTFAQFISASGLAEVKFREGTDILVAPHEHAASLYQEEISGKPHRIREDFWKAFVSWPRSGEVRGYIPDLDKVVDGLTTLPPQAIPIEPISREVLRNWHKQFVAELGSDLPPRMESILPSLENPGGFYEFSRAVRGDPQLHAKWNRFHLSKVLDAIRDWANHHGVTGEPWLQAQTEEREGDKRAHLYAVLDRIPLESLLKIQIPLGWLVEEADKE
jgi:hypothetical protein